MIRRLAFVVAAALATGCATPTAIRAAHPGAETPPPHLFDGCQLLPRATTADGYAVRCGGLFASVIVVRGEQPLGQLVVSFLHGLERSLHGEAELGRVPRGLMIAGRRRYAIIGVVHPPHEPLVDTWLGAVSAWHTGDGRSTVMSCGVPGPGSPGGGASGDLYKDRCRQLFDWMAVHTTPPRGVPVATGAGNPPSR